MSTKIPVWLDEEKGTSPSELKIIEEKKMAHFGCRLVPEDEKALWVLNHFNTTARNYDLMNTVLSLGLHRLWKRVAVKMLQLRNGECVLDLAGGTGDLSVLASRAVGKTGEVFLYDINWKMLETGRPKVKKTGSGNRIYHIQGDAEQMSFPDQSFDAIIIGFGIRNLTHMDKGAKEMFRVLKPGGRMIFLEFSKPESFIFRKIYDFYSFYIMPFLGELMMGSRNSYIHLPESIRKFHSDELIGIFSNAGFSGIKQRKLTNGVAVVISGSKKQEDTCCHET